MLKELQGEWRLVSHTHNGQKHNFDNHDGRHFIHCGPDRVRQSAQGGNARTSFGAG